MIYNLCPICNKKLAADRQGGNPMVGFAKHIERCRLRRKKIQKRKRARGR